jgi:hypothetical protein
LGETALVADAQVESSLIFTQLFEITVKKGRNNRGKRVRRQRSSRHNPRLGIYRALMANQAVNLLCKPAFKSQQLVSSSAKRRRHFLLLTEQTVRSSLRRQ